MVTKGETVCGVGGIHFPLDFSGNLTVLKKKVYNLKKKKKAPLTFVECSVQERVIEEEAASFCPTLGLSPHHQLAATWSFETLGGNAEKRE